jgi:hypothetical protein
MRRLAKRSILAVAHNADDFQKWPFWSSYADAPAERVFTRPEPSGERFVYYYCSR